MNTVHGASDTIDFLNFFGEAGNAVNIETERPALEVGDIVVMDNCPTHHFAGGEALQEWLSDRNIELVYILQPILQILIQLNLCLTK